jgi:hypothetical protein
LWTALLLAATTARAAPAPAAPTTPADMEARVRVDRWIDFKGQHVPAALLLSLVSDKLDVTHNGIRISNAVVDGPLDLRRIKAQFDVRCFRCTFGDVYLSESSFDGDLMLTESTFHDLLADRVHVGGALVLDGVNANALRFYFARVEGPVQMQGVRAAAVDFRHARFGSSFDLSPRAADRPTLISGEALFHRMTVDDELILASARFDGAFDCGSVEAKSLIARSTWFAQRAVFDSIEVSGPANFDGAQLRGGAALSYVQLGSLAMTHVTVPGAVDLRGARIDGMTVLSGQFGAPVDLSDARLFTLDLAEAQLPSSSVALKLAGTTYHRLESGPKKTPLELVNQSQYAADAYTAVESFLRGEGEEALADEAYVEHKRHERARMRTFSAWAWSYFEDKVIKYGRQPARSLYWAVGFLLVGLLVFWRRDTVEAVDPRDEHRRYNPFWFSVDAFAPVIDLEEAKRWTVRQDRRWASLYFKLHRLAGWVVVPFALAALSGILGK